MVVIHKLTNAANFSGRFPFLWSKVAELPSAKELTVFHLRSHILPAVSQSGQKDGLHLQQTIDFQHQRDSEHDTAAKPRNGPQLSQTRMLESP